MFKPGDKVMCIDITHLSISKKLILYKIYTINESFSYKKYNFVVLEIMNKTEYNSDRFISLKEFRKQKLIQLKTQS